MNKIDSHQHVFWHGKDDVGLIADMDEQEISVAWLLTWEILPFEHYPHYTEVLNPLRVRPDGSLEGIPLDDLLIARNKYPDRFVLGFCPHPLKGNASARLTSAARIHGARVCGEWKFRIPFDDPRCIELFRTAGELDMPVVLHLDVPYLPDNSGKRIYQQNWYGGTVENLERALILCRDTKFIGHAPGFWREISADADSAGDVYPTGAVKAPGKLQKLIDKYPNLFADLSAGSALLALRRDPDYAKTFLINYADRLLFGRDFYGGELDEFLCGLDLPIHVKERIFFKNATKLLSS